MSGITKIYDKPIAAIATPMGYGGICVVRISGAGVFEVTDRLLRDISLKCSDRKHGTFFHSKIYDCETAEVLDDGLVLIFKSPKSYTGEDTVEIQGHGGVIPAERLLNATIKAGAVLADPGEFTKRAFLNGQLDLTQAEAICDLIQSQTERAASVARSQLDGALGDKIHRMYDEAVDISSGLEHVLDFDEGDISDKFVKKCIFRIESLKNDVAKMVVTWRDGELLRQGVLIVLSGSPNAGKSSLLNALLERNRAIVHNTPGTTRDVIEESYSLSGVPVRLVDTAGLRESSNVIECEGIKRAHEFIDKADINLLVVDLAESSNIGIASILEIFDKNKLIVVLNKADIGETKNVDIPEGIPFVTLSALTGEGLDELREVMVDQLGIKEDFQTQTVIAQRHLEELRDVENELQSAQDILNMQITDIVISAEHLSSASECLGRITGRVYSEDLLDNIFSKFCVGK